MNHLKVNKKSVSLVQKSTKNFNALWGPLNERPLVDRVVSTSQWPVPYYQRAYKAYPIRERKDKLSLLLSDHDVDDCNWYQAKQVLQNHIEEEKFVNGLKIILKLPTYIVVQDDVSKMANAYVSDLAAFLACANNENKRILAKMI